MELLVRRHWLSEKSSVGELFVNGASECYTLEDKTRGAEEPKVYGETAIPLGRYEVIINHSPHFSQLLKRDVELPLLLDVPNFQGVRIHPGNRPSDTEGCILVGRRLGGQPDEILESQLAFDALFTKMKAARDRGERMFITLEVDASKLVQ